MCCESLAAVGTVFDLRGVWPTEFKIAALAELCQSSLVEESLAFLGVTGYLMQVLKDSYVGTQQ